MQTEYDPFDIAKNLEHEEALAEFERIAISFEIEDFKRLMQEAYGRRFIGRLLERAGVYRTSFAAENNRTNFNEGMRNFGILLVSLINEHCPERYPEMIADIKARSTPRK